EFPESVVYGVDQDGEAIENAKSNLREFGDRFIPLRGNFCDLERLLAPYNIEKADAFLFDLGVSNMQLSIAERGFAFQLDGPLDMRMNKDAGEPASVAVNSLSAKELTDIFQKFGEERFAWRIACGIEKKRKNNYIETTGQLVSLIREILPAPVQRKMGGHPARRVFQALRIYVNRELDALPEGLSACIKFSSVGTEVVVVSYHSLEDRIVKHMFLQWKREGLGEILTKHPVLPSDDETASNFKSRSAKLRAFRFL
ncbi:MAG: 16S rRNA (cytosine(1402)-N(4))-methyltransferase RsmH, partial [Synergistaceae bacterium]|nr:16S rRNA (cytosine(1402)-N(4))-methyltransferase RsmH [Synergistaceae bacterium]